MEKTSLAKAREHANDGKMFLKTKEYEKALKQFEFSIEFFLDVLSGKFALLCFWRRSFY